MGVGGEIHVAVVWASTAFYCLALVLLLHSPFSGTDPQFTRYIMIIYTPVSLFLQMGWLFGFVLWVLHRNNLTFSHNPMIESPPEYLSASSVWDLCCVYSLVFSTAVFGTYAYAGGLMYPGSLIPVLMWIPMMLLLVCVFVPIWQHELRWAKIKQLIWVFSPTANWWTRLFGEVMTSLSSAWSQLEFTVCFYVSGTFAMSYVPARIQTPPSCGPHSWNYAIVVPLLMCLPWFWRMGHAVGQMIIDRSRWVRHFIHFVLNGITIAMIIVGSASPYFHLYRDDFSRWTGWDIAWLVLFLVHIVARSIWDFVAEWRLWDCSSVSPRSSSLFSVGGYVCVIVLNIVGIVCYALVLSLRHVGEEWVLPFAVVELIRRAMWMLVYVEAEQADGAEREQLLKGN